MYNNTIDNNNAIYLDTKSNNNKRHKKIYCVLCFEKTELRLFNEEESRYKCPRCKNDYQILDIGEGGDLLPEEDELVSSHEQNEEGPILFTVSDTNTDTNSILDREKRKNIDIKIPWYMKDSATTKVTYYREE